jgi:hypothetical protein
VFSFREGLAGSLLALGFSRSSLLGRAVDPKSEGFATFLGEGNSKTSKIFGHAPTAVSKGNSVNIPKPEGWIEGCSFHLFAFLGGNRGIRGLFGFGRDFKVFSGFERASFFLVFSLFVRGGWL